MKISINFLNKSTVAERVGTLVGPLSRMDTQMVKKVVPLVVYLFAVFEVAFEEQLESPGAWIRKSKHSVSTCCWYFYVFHTSVF